eukprot:g1613.t1
MPRSSVVSRQALKIRPSMCESVESWMLSVLLNSSSFVDESTAPALGACAGDVEALRAALTDGCILCEVANAVKPGTIKRYNKRRNGAPIKMKFKRLENLQKFTEACRFDFELPDVCVFGSSDLDKIEGMGAVLSCLRELERMARSPAQVEASKPKNLVEKRGYDEDEECFYMGEYSGEVEGPIALRELRALYNSGEIGVDCQVSFGEDWFQAVKWLGAREMPEDLASSGIWKGGAGIRSRKSTVASRQSSVPDDAIWYYRDLDTVPAEDVGPFTLIQMQDWVSYGKIQPEQLVWCDENGDGVFNDADTVAVAAGTASGADLDNAKEYRRGLLGKFARGRKRTSIGKKLFQRKNWQKRFFVLRRNRLEYFASRSKFIKRGLRSGGFDLRLGDDAVCIDNTKGDKGRFYFELRRGEACLLSMFAEDKVDRDCWVEAIRSSITDNC